MDLTTDEATLAHYHWSGGNKEAKARLFEHQARYREIFVRAPDDKFFLFDRLDPSLWPELIKLDYNILDRCVQNTPTVLNALASLSAAESVKAFHYIRNYDTRRSVLRRVNADSRVRVLKGTTQASLARMRQLKAKPVDGYFFMSTSDFLATLPSSAQPCCGAGCLVDNKMPFEGLAVFTVAKCLQHSFHIQCAKSRVCCTTSSSKLPTEIWHNIARHASVFTAGLLALGFGIFPATQRHQRVWYEIFKDDSWLDFVVQNGAHPGLLGPGVHPGVSDKSSECTRYLILLLHKGRMVHFEESKRLFFTSLRLHTASMDSKHEILVGGIRLNIRELLSGSLIVPDSMEPHQFTYCFYSDILRSLRSINSGDVVSQNGKVFCLKLFFAAQEKLRNTDDVLAMQGVKYTHEERAQMYQVLIYSRSLSSLYRTRLGDRLPALEGTLYEREITGLDERAIRRYGDEEYEFATLHPHDVPLLRS